MTVRRKNSLGGWRPLALMGAALVAGCDPALGLRLGLGGTPAIVSASATSLTVRVSLPAARRVQATVAQVASLRIDVLPAGTASQSQTVSRADFIGDGQAVAVFGPLPAGSVGVAVAALAESGQAIGVASGTTTLITGSATTLNLDLTLEATEIVAGALDADLAVTAGPRILVTPAPAPFGQEASHE